MLILAIVLAFVAIVMLWLVGRQQKQTGLPGGRVVYADTSRWGALEKPLYDPALGLTGKPDYLVDQGDQIIPVEVKSKIAGQVPYDSHIYQLASYCLLVERQLGKRPNHGLLKYPNQVFAIDYTPTLEATLLGILSSMRVQERRKDVPRSHDAPQRCMRCGYRSVCNQSLQGTFER